MANGNTKVVVDLPRTYYALPKAKALKLIDLLLEAEVLRYVGYHPDDHTLLLSPDPGAHDPQIKTLGDGKIRIVSGKGLPAPQD